MYSKKNLSDEQTFSLRLLCLHNKCGVVSSCIAVLTETTGVVGVETTLTTSCCSVGDTGSEEQLDCRVRLQKRKKDK